MARLRRQTGGNLFDDVVPSAGHEAGDLFAPGPEKKPPKIAKKNSRKRSPPPEAKTSKARLPEAGVLSGYQAMWLFAMFDLPVDTKDARRQYTQFRKTLIREGFSMLQYSVYARYCPGEEVAAGYRQRLRPLLPPDGQVRLMSVTERQFGKMEVYFGKARKPTEDPPVQLLLF